MYFPEIVHPNISGLCIWNKRNQMLPLLLSWSSKMPLIFIILRTTMNSRIFELLEIIHRPTIIFPVLLKRHVGSKVLPLLGLSLLLPSPKRHRSHSSHCFSWALLLLEFLSVKTLYLFLSLKRHSNPLYNPIHCQ